MSRAALAVALLLVSSVAHADPKADATVLLNDGVTLLKQQDFAAALTKFEEAYATYPSPKIFANLASSLKGLGRLAEAANFEQRYLDEGDPDAKNRRAAEKTLAELDAKLGFVLIVVEPADGAELRIGDGAWMPVGTLAKWRVTPGEITVEVRRPGSRPAATRANVKRGAIQELTFALGPEVAVVEPERLEPDPEPEPGPEPEPEQPDEPTSPRRTRIGAIVHALIDGKGRGGAGAIGAMVAFGERLDVEAAAILGPTFGAYVGVGVALTTGALRPRLTAGVPVYVSDGPRWAVRGAGGVEWQASARLSLVVELGVEYMLGPEMDIDTFQFVPVIGAHGKL